MFEKIADLFRVYRAGMSLATVVKGKQIQIAAGYIAALLTALVGLAKAFGVDLVLTDAQIMELSGAVVTVFGLFNHGLTVATTTKVGLLGQTPDIPSQSGSEPVNLRVEPGLSSVSQDIPAAMSSQRRARNGDIIPDREPSGP
jgi:hypothetical protein